MQRNSGWEQLVCQYFYGTSVRVLGAYFSSLGFVPNKTTINGALFTDGQTYIEVSYVPESAPKYSPTLVVGIGDRKFDSVGNPTGVPAWRITPENSEARGFSSWGFSSDPELETVFNNLRDKVIEPYLRPLWEDRERLNGAANDFSC